MRGSSPGSDGLCALAGRRCCAHRRWQQFWGVATIGHHLPQALHPIGILLECSDFGQRLRLTGKRSIERFCCRAKLGTCSGRRASGGGRSSSQEAITAGITPCVGFTGYFAFSPAFPRPVPRPLGALSCCRRLRPVPLVRPPHTERAWRRPVFLRDLGVARQEHCPASLRRVRAPSARPAAMSQSSHWPL